MPWLRRLAALLAVGTILSGVSAHAGTPDPLKAQFRDPPASARPRVWWHWMNGNVTQDGISKDLAWMKRVGIGGAQAFDANYQTPQIVPKRLIYMTPEWKQAFRFAASEAERLGLELGIASSPGFSESGGPWVEPADGLKKLVWSETDVVGGRTVGRLASPPAVTGPFQSLPADPHGGSMLSGGAEVPIAAPLYRDVAVLAVPIGAVPVLGRPVASDGAGNLVDSKLLVDNDLATGIELDRKGAVPPAIQLTYPHPVTIRSATLFATGVRSGIGGGMVQTLEADAGTGWRPITEFAADALPTTMSFAPVTAARFRIVFTKGKPASMAGSAPPFPGIDLFGFGKLLSGAAKTPPLKVVDFRLFGDPKVDRFETKAGFAMTGNFAALSAGVPPADGADPSKVIDLTSHLKPDGTLDWTPPNGRWRILRLGWSLIGTVNHPASPEANGLEVDKFDGAAVRRYAEHYIGMFRDAVGNDLIGTHGLKAVVHDSIEIGAANWTPRLIEQFRTRRGYDPTPWLPVLTGTLVGTRDQSDRFLADFRKTLSDLMASEHYATFASVAHEHGLKVYAEALEDHRPVIGDDMAMRTPADVPMGAMWSFTRAAGVKPTYLADLKGAASIAHVYGKNLVGAESLTSLMAPWAYGPGDLKRMIDLEFANGVNLPSIHTSVHVPIDDKQPGLSLFFFGQYFNRNESWAELARPWMDYIARNSLMLQQGRNVADVAYFYGEEAPLTALFGDKPVKDAPRERGYDFVNADALLGNLSVENGEVVSTGGARYRMLWLGQGTDTMSLPVLRKLAALVEQGAIVAGGRPVARFGLGGDEAEFTALQARLWPGSGDAQVGKGRVIVADAPEPVLERLLVRPDFRVAGGQADSEVLFSHRRLADGDSYFLSNRKDRAEIVEAHFRVAGKIPELWRPEAGGVEPLSYRIENGETVVPLFLAPDDAFHVVFRKPAVQAALVVPVEQSKLVATMTGPWRVAFEPGRGAPSQVTMTELRPLDRNADPDIAHFSGIATYAHDFALPRSWKPARRVLLDLGEVREIAEVRVNDQIAGYAWHAPWQVDVSSFVHGGRNRLEIRVANLWVNRMIGDAAAGTIKVAWTAIPTYRADAPLRRSGLIGPVRLLDMGKYSGK